ncbi:tetraspanin-9 [Beta vulgaris subsp. vulgaris]|uniref:tetraspanin-9 n=1 Tax=Beta vulgaris subsp. vulgaris TaxID=3555 RepID=UPI0020371004|nr:tetraspanin-9 [Beta vulgaris subsp. vulgaris]
MVRPRDLAKMNDESLFLYGTMVVDFCFGLLGISCGASLLWQTTSACTGFRFLGITLIVIGVSLMLLFCINCFMTGGTSAVAIGAGKLVCSVPLILTLFALGIFVLSVSSKGGGKSVPGKSYKEYHVESYSKWMQNKIAQNWDNYYHKAVVKDKKYVCMKFYIDDVGVDSAFRLGCCKPPQDCNFSYNNSGVWVKPENATYSNIDCDRWNDDPNTLCFNCESCKAGFLQDVTSHWFTVGCTLVGIVAVPLLIVILGSICFMCSNRSSDGYARLL